jgi:signal transduction histidine kinase
MNELCHPWNAPEQTEPKNSAMTRTDTLKRIDRRFDVNQTARLFMPGDTLACFEARILDVSRRGLRLLVDLPLPGPCVRVEWNSRELHGVIRHQQPDRAGYRVGIELEPGSETVVSEMLAQHATEVEKSNQSLREQTDSLRRTKERLVSYAEALAKKNDDLCEAVDAARQASEFKSRFLASVSHELRTPLNGIIGFAQMFYDGALGPITDVQRECLGDMLNCSEHLLTLISHVLDLTKIESGKMTFQYQPISLGKIIRDSIGTLQPIAESKRVTVEYLEDAEIDMVEADIGKLKQVLYNYLSNALKFTPNGGCVQVSVSMVNPAFYRIGVRDSGRGIAPDDISRLFTEFGQLCAGKAQVGSGLGLAITKRIAEAQGGHVGVESELGKGSFFYAVLPIAPRAQVSCGMA